ncbi:MAG: guanylate kinase [Clostridia bacterium]|nr:guanylate kinase [Clostridia bacterium]
MKKSLLIVLSGPSGVGKGTINEMLSKKLPKMIQSVSVTTRRPRKGEKDGVHYFFRTEEEFKQLKESGMLLEYAETFSHFYGTPRSFVEENLKSGRDVMLEIDVKGAIQVKKSYPECVSIFIVPPDMNELERRLRLRGTEDEKELKERLRVAEEEILQSSFFDFVVVNDDLSRAVNEIISVINTKRK